MKPQRSKRKKLASKHALKASLTRDVTTTRSPNNRSSVTNGQRFLPRGVHSQSTWARIARDVLAALYAHLGGEGEVTETQRLLIRRVATLEAELVHYETKFALAREKGEEPKPTDVELYGRLSDRQRRLAEPLGWRRAARDITPTLEAYADEIEAVA